VHPHLRSARALRGRHECDAPAHRPAADDAGLAAIWIYVFLSSIRDVSLPIILRRPQNRLIAV